MNEIDEKDLEGLSHREIVMFALFCAKQVIHLVESKEAHDCINIVELYLKGKATKEDCKKAAWAAAWAAEAAAEAAARAAGAAWAAGAAGAAGAAWAAAWGAVGAVKTKEDKEVALKEQHKYLYELKNINKIIEETFL